MVPFLHTVRKGHVLSVVSNTRCPGSRSEGKPVFPGTSFIQKEARLPGKTSDVCLLMRGEWGVSKGSLSSSGNFK